MIQYNAAGGTQTVTLQYDEIPNITTTLDRANYPPSSQVFITIKDMQLNQDPTSRDSWTFNIGSPQTVFYAAFTENGANAATGSVGLTNLISKLSSLGFDNNGKVAMSLGSVAQLQANGHQTATATDGTTTFSQITTAKVARVWFLIKVPTATPTTAKTKPEITAAKRVLMITVPDGSAASG